MVRLLSRLFIKNYRQYEAPQVRQAYGILCGALGICLNLLLFGGKFLAGFLGNSIAITADAFNNLSDAGSSLITLVGFKMAGQKPDPSHPFGHGRIEYISGLLVAVMILMMALELIKSSLQKIIHPEESIASPLIIIILLCSIAVKCYMGYYNRKIGKKINSSAMEATALDSLSDTLATTLVLAATLISHFTGVQIDGFCGVLVGLFIFYAGFCAAKDTISPLLGQAADPEFVKQIQEIVLSHEGIIGIHDLIVHNYGPGRVIISLHAEVPAEDDVLIIHERIDDLEHKLQNTLHCSAVIHMDPILTKDEETTRLKAQVSALLSDISPLISMHDFRLVKGTGHSNLIFDVAVPFRFHMTDDALKQTISQRIKTLDANYCTVIDIDKV
ncbi:MAG: cation diffusion facilitator family transporter [Roseburia sp.]|nr:cation diffusion facilitator family transporter [Roseburia sp.]